MDRSERFRKIIQLLRHQAPVPLARMLAELEVSPATVKRDLEYLRDRFSAPIIWDRAVGGYRLSEGGEGMPKFELPGFWLNQQELHALLAMESLLGELQPGLLTPHLEPLRDHLRELLKNGGYAAGAITDKVRVLHAAARPVRQKYFPLIMAALLEEKRLMISHHNRAADRITDREISPQRLTYYRDNWYLDAFCHLRDDLRCFSLDAIRSGCLLPENADRLSRETLDRFFAAAYGIFAGGQTQNAVLSFSPPAARWVAAEQWHPAQQGRTLTDGSYLLSFPYANDTELIMDILRHGPDVEVLAPPALREKVKERLRESLKKYADE